MAQARELGNLFVRTARKQVDHHTSKLLRCLSLLAEDEVWKRSNEQVNSVGHLVLHLCGNLRQWIISGIGGAEDIRERREEFHPPAYAPKAALRAMVEKTAAEADRALADFDVNLLEEVRVIQGFPVTCMEAIYSTTEHWSHHVGQIIHIAKTALNRDLELTHLTPEGYNPD